MEIDSDELALAVEEQSKEASLEIANEWFSRSQETLYARGDTHDFDVQSVAQAALPPQWDAEDESAYFHYGHEATEYLEFGAKEHEIEAVEADALAFEWEEMAGVPFGDTGMTWDEVFEHSWPTVFLQSVTHPGIPALRFLRDTREQVAERYHDP